MYRKFSKSTVIAIFAAIGVAAWMLSGSLSSGKPDARQSIGGSSSNTINGNDTATERASVRVAVEQSIAQTVARDVIVSGRTEPNRSVEIRAETEGRVVAILADRGAAVAAGALLVRLDIRDREARKTEAEALVAQHRLQFEAAQKLLEQNLLSESQIAESRTRLVSAQAALENIVLEINRTQVVVPFDAIVQNRVVEIGDFIKIGDPIAELVDINPLIVVGDVSEREINNLVVGATGFASMQTGKQLEGIVRYVSPVADPATRTFKVELAVDNPDNILRGGITAQLQIATDEVQGHLLAPSVLTLDDSGSVGVKLVDENNLAHFYPVEILRSTEEGVWVSGLPNPAQVISIGQGFVTDGQRVDPVLAAELSAAR